MSTVKANDLTNVTGGIPTVKGQKLIPTAWVNFNGTGTVAIRDSENVSSITDHASGDYTVTFATQMANANYASGGSAGASTGSQRNIAQPLIRSIRLLAVVDIILFMQITRFMMLQRFQ